MENVHSPARTKRDGNVLRVRPPERRKYIIKDHLATNVHLKRSVELENVHSPVQTNRDGNVLGVCPPGRERKMEEMTTWLQTSTSSDHLGWKTSTYNRKTM